MSDEELQELTVRARAKAAIIMPIYAMMKVIAAAEDILAGREQTIGDRAYIETKLTRYVGPV